MNSKSTRNSSIKALHKTYDKENIFLAIGQFYMILTPHRGNTMLSSTSLGDDAALVHAQAQQRLPQGVVDLMCASVVQVLALQVNFRARAVWPARIRCARLKKRKHIAHMEVRISSNPMKN